MEEPEKRTFKTVWSHFYSYVLDITNLHDDTNIEATINSIKKDIVFNGSNVWILFFAIIVASVGLNVNSTAVIIGAMLISPLMGPINGIGLAIGINDNDLFRNSLKNFVVMVLISVMASTFYFLVSPLSDAQSELLARTKPTIFDVLIALFGGLAGIVAASRKEGKVTIISGVAIATALMPPLCTAGYGLSSGQLNYFFGAFYLFFINSFFIALATFLMVRFLHFPAIEYTDLKKKRMVKRGITIFSIMVIIPSVYIAWTVVNETRFNSLAIKYVQSLQEEEVFDEVEILNIKREYTPQLKKLSLSLIGKPLTSKQIERLEKRLLDFGLNNTKLTIKQTNGSLDLGTQTGMIAKILDNKEEQLLKKDSLIDRITIELNKLKNDGVDKIQLSKEMMIQYPNIVQFSLSNTVYTNMKTQKQDTIPTLYVEWKSGSDNIQTKKLSDWLKVRLQLKRLKIISIK